MRWLSRDAPWRVSTEKIHENIIKRQENKRGVCDGEFKGEELDYF